MKFLFFALIAASTTFAHAADYQCAAKANPNRGFSSDFKITVTPAAIGGKIILLVGGKERELGVVADIGAFDRVTQKDAFDLILGYIWEQDVSGVSSVDIAKVSMIKVYKAPGDEEVSVYQLFADDKQIGGTFSASGMGTACMP